MSWIVYLMGAAGFDSVRDFPEGWSPPPLGPRESIIRRLREVLPTAVFSHPAEGSFHGEGFSLTFDLGPWEPCPRVRLIIQHPRQSPRQSPGAGGDTATHEEALGEALDLLGRVAEALDARALDTGLGDFMRFHKDPLSGRLVWRDAPRLESHWAPA